MLEVLDSADDVIAVSISHKVEGKDFEAVIDRMEQALDRHETIHVFAETRAIDGIEISGLGSHMARAMPFIGKLGRFGRVAVVADQAWLRAGSRIESAILPNISYRVYMPEERDEAFAWVTGASSG